MDDFLCRQDCDGAKDAQWASTLHFAICAQVMIYLDFVLIPKPGFLGLHHIALFFFAIIFNANYCCV